MDPNKYLKDALILEKAYAEALKNKDDLFHRYAYYCANSYKDCGKFEDAIKWYKITLSHANQWDQEKYTSCLYIYDCYKALNQEPNGFYYLVKAFEYDKERVECLYPLLVHYCCENIHQIAYSYYTNVKDFFENRYLATDMSRKLFTIPDKYNFFVPYYMILIADKVQDFACVVRMYEIIFIKKQPMFEEWYIKNLLYNLHFFLQYIPKDNKHFSKLANNYITFLFENGVKIQSFDFLTKDEYKRAGIDVDNYIIKEVTLKPQKYSNNECAGSKNILIYTGFLDIEWNYTYMQNNALGGSEKAVAYISKCFPKDFNIFISGHVKNETIDNIQYIHLDQLTNLIERTPFHTVIVSRYIGFYEMFQTCSYYKSFIWAHDTVLLPYGSNLNDNHILKKWNNYIDGCVCLTEWHKALFSEKYPELSNKITLINNGLDIDSFSTIDTNNKIKNKFIYTSRPDRGLNILLKLWPQIIEKIPDATLTISTYGSFPSNPEELAMKTVIDATPSIHYLGKLNVEQLYLEMSTAEFWLYPTNWPETSCITALEMLMSEVICLYYPVAGLPFTIDKYGIQIKSGSEIEAIVSLTVSQKRQFRKNGREYASYCSWENRAKKWSNLLFLDNDSLNIEKRTFTNNNIENTKIIDYKIEYGVDDNKINITHTVISHLLNKEFIEIPTNDILRAELYGDPCWGVVKSIYITTKDGSVTKCKDNYPIILNWQGILIKKPNFKYKLSACLLIKNETENLNDWIQHYINEGVEHFFITSNNSTDGIDNFILNSKYKNMITLITDNSDINIYNDQVKHREILCKNFYNIIKNSTEWCILVDIDEFMYGKNGYTLSSFIDTLDEDIGCFYVYWNIFKPTLDSENNISDKFSLKKSCKRINLDLISDLSYEIKFVSKFGKSIFRTSMLQEHTQIWIHKVHTSGKIITNYGNISNYKYDNDDDINWSESNYTKVNVALNHYAIRNKKDYDNKSRQLENTHRYPFVKGLLDIFELDNNYIIEDEYILNKYRIPEERITYSKLLFNQNTITNFDNNIRNRIYELHNIGFIPKNHIEFLKNLAINFTPKIIYDIGSNVLSWTREAKKIWPTSEIIAFDAIENVEFLYKEHNIKYHIGVLSKEDNSVVRFYENNVHPAGNSYYKEIGHSISNELYPENVYTEKNTHTLSTVVKTQKFPLPDLIKIDVQGAELDIIMGGLDVINSAKYLIVELQDTQYNKGAPLAETTIKFLENNRWELVAPKFCDNGPDADYCFKNMRYNDDVKKIAIFNSFPFHYEMFGYIIEYCKKHKYKLTIFTNTDNSLGWLEFYNSHFSSDVFDFEYKTINEFEELKEQFDVIFVTTDDDYAFKPEWINERCISINHHYTIRRPEYKYNLATRLFIDNIRDWAIPCYQILNIYDKQNMFESDINIAIIGSYNGLKSNIINRLESNNKITLHICGRYSNNININPNITVNHYLKIDTMELICLLKKCDYILTDCSNNDDHIKGYGMSGAIPLAFSTLTPLIISKQNNNMYKFKNVIEFDYDVEDKIIINKSLIDLNLLDAEREALVSMLPEWLNKNDLLDYNIFYFEHDDVHVRLLQNEQNKTIYQNFSNRSNAEIMFRKLVSYIMPNFIDKNIIDLGAYIGDNAVPWALKMRGIIYAIDPSKENISFIKKMAFINNVNNIVTIEKAISDKNETIYCNETETTHISCNTSNGIHSFNAVSLDCLNLENIGFIHLDVEGFEYKVLYGAINIITKYNPIIVWENHIEREDYMKVVNFFSYHKYTTYMINEQFPHCFPDCRNFISFPENCNISVNELNHKFKKIYTEFTPDKNNPFLISIKSHITSAIPNNNIIKKDSNKIPSKIFQTWETCDIEQEFQQIINKWKENNPDYEYIFHDAEQRLQFIQDNFEENVLNAYKKIIPGAYKCDLWRYCILYIYGGFYADIDTLCMGKLNSLTNTNIEFIVPIDLNINPREGQHNLACGFIGSVPKSPILLDAIDRIVFNVENNIIPTSKLDFSGPGLLGRAVNKFLNLDETNSFKGKEGIQNNINFLEFDPNTEYMKDVYTDTIILQNKNKNSDIIRLYNNECNKIKNYTCWLSNNIIKMT